MRAPAEPELTCHGSLPPALDSSKHSGSARAADRAVLAVLHMTAPARCSPRPKRQFTAPENPTCGASRRWMPTNYRSNSLTCTPQWFL